MAKKNQARAANKPADKPQPVTQTPVPEPVSQKPSLYDFKVQAIIVSLLAFVLYFNSFFNEYAHDDGIVIVKNEYVQEGFAGIPKIFTSDAYDSYYRQLNTTNQLSGGRYRPLSIVTFAIEQQFMGAVAEKNIDSLLKDNIAHGVKGKQEQKLVSIMHVRHVVNVLFYMLSVVVFLYFLRYIVFRDSPIMALIAAIIFTVHPIHTEVVANVKSRDEIMSLMFMCATFILDFKYREEKNIKMLIGAMVCYACAFLSKEYAITMLFLLPMAHYTFNKKTLGQSIIMFAPYALVIVGYIALRHSIVAPPGENSDSEVLNNPYVFASATDKLATEIATSLNYIKLLIFPHPLSADYSYDSIPYKSFSNPLVWLSLAVYLGMTVVMFVQFSKRSVLSFAIAFYLLHFALICNIFFDIGATMGERLIYHSSAGFAIAVAYLLVKGAEKFAAANAHKVLAGVMGVIIVLSGIKTIARNADWKNDTTLFAADIHTVPNSVLVCANVAASEITEADEKEGKDKTELLHKAIGLLDHALSIHPDMVASYMNRAIAYYKLGDMDKAKANLDEVKKRYPSYPTLPGIYRLVGEDYNKKGWEQYGKKGMFPEAIAEFKKGLAIDSTNSDLWYNLGGAYYSNRQYAEAAQAWNITLKINPNYTKARQGLQAAIQAMTVTGQQQKK